MKREIQQIDNNYVNSDVSSLSFALSLSARVRVQFITEFKLYIFNFSFFHPLRLRRVSAPAVVKGTNGRNSYSIQSANIFVYLMRQRNVPFTNLQMKYER